MPTRGVVVVLFPMGGGLRRTGQLVPAENSFARMTLSYGTFAG